MSRNGGYERIPILPGLVSSSFVKLYVYPLPEVIVRTPLVTLELIFAMPSIFAESVVSVSSAAILMLDFVIAFDESVTVTYSVPSVILLAVAPALVYAPLTVS